MGSYSENFVIRHLCILPHDRAVLFSVDVKKKKNTLYIELLRVAGRLDCVDSFFIFFFGAPLSSRSYSSTIPRLSWNTANLIRSDLHFNHYFLRLLNYPASFCSNKSPESALVSISAAIALQPRRFFTSFN